MNRVNFHVRNQQRGTLNAMLNTQSPEKDRSAKPLGGTPEGIGSHSAKYQHVTPHDYQIRLTEEIVTILQTSQHGYLEAPTATGKTLVLALIADELGISDVYYMVNTTELVEQTKQEIEGMMYAGLIDPNIKWNFMTWQAYVAMVKRRPADDPLPRHLALVDECHIGGVKNSGPDKVSFPLIKATATKVLWISATPWNLDEKIMGARGGNTAYYSYNAAFARGSLNQTQLIRVDCSLNMKLKLNNESPTVRELVAAQTETMNIEADTAEQTFEELERQVQELLGRPLKTTDIPTLVKHRYMLMAEIYRSKHSGEKAIFWVPNQRYAKDCADYINKLFDDPNYAGTFLGDKSQSVEEKRAQETLNSFRDLNGKVKVICVVYRLRAGFDYPQLANGFDCAWNPYNYRNAVQKIGRLVRTAAAKPTGNYYYAVDAVAIAAAANRNFAAKFLGGLQDKYSPEDLSLTAHALADAKAFDQELQPNTPSIKSPPIIEVIALPRRYITTAGIALFNVIDASRSIERASIDLTEMFGLTKEQRLEQLLSNLEAGIVKLQTNTPDYHFIKSYINPSRHNFRNDVRARLIACGAIRHIERTTPSRIAADMELLRRIEIGELEFFYGNDNYKRLTPYFQKGKQQYIPEVRKRLLEAGLLREKLNLEQVSELIDRIVAGELDFSNGSPLYKRLSFYLSPASRRFNEGLRDRLVKAGKLSPKNPRKIRSEPPRQRPRLNVEAIVRGIETGDIDYKAGTKAYNQLAHYVRPTGRNYKPDLRDRLIKAGKLTNRNPTDRIETILKQVESGEIDFKPGSEAYSYLIPLVAPQSHRYQPAVRDRLIKAGKLNPRNSTARITALLDKIENGTVSFQPNSKNYQYLATYFSPNSASYRPEVRARLIAAGKLSERKRNDIEALLIKVESGEDPFKTRSETYKILTSFFSPKGKSYRADVRERLIKAGKLKPASARLSIPELLIQIETGLIEFSPGTKAYRSLRPYFLPSGKKYDPDIRRRLISAGKLPTDQWPSNQKRSNTTHNNKN